MSIYDFDTPTYVDNNLPPDKRLPKILTYVKSLLSALQTSIDYYKIYREGDVYTPWDAITLYAIGDIVYYQGKNYIAIQAHSGRQPLDTDYWTIQNPSSLGSDERVRYQPNKLIFEYALNRFFGSTFRQPPLISDIFITNTAYFNPSKIIGGIESNSSAVYSNRSDGVIINDYFVQLPYSFEINIPALVYADAGGNDAAIRQFADKITVAGKSYIITQY